MTLIIDLTPALNSVKFDIIATIYAKPVFMIPPIYLLADDQVSASSIAGPVDVFHVANLLIKNINGNEAEQLRWQIIGLNKKQITSASGMVFKADALLKQIKQPGWIFLPGIIIESEPEMQVYLQQNQPLAEELKQLFKQGFSMTANCTGTFLLAETGLLNGLSTTTAWWLENLFQKRYPEIDLDIDSLIIEHDRIICSGTATAYTEQALSLVKKLLGGKYEHLCRKYMLMENSHNTQAPYKRLTHTHQDPFMQMANRYLLEHLHKELRMQEVANALAVSNRTLIRRIKHFTGDSPVQHIQKLRIERSKYLLETSSLLVDEITERVGYKNSSTFGQVFKRFTNLTPAQYRQKFCIHAH